MSDPSKLNGLNGHVDKIKCTIRAHRKLIAVLTAVVATATGIASIEAGIRAWDRNDLPRPAMRHELQRIEEEGVDTRLRLLRLQKQDAQQAVRDLEVLITKLLTDGTPIPLVLQIEKDAKQQAIIEYDQQIRDLVTRQQ